MAFTEDHELSNEGTSRKNYPIKQTGKVLSTSFGEYQMIAKVEFSVVSLQTSLQSP